MSKAPDWVQRAREAWVWRGKERPPFAAPPGPGQESVWDYPRPPILVSDPRRVRIELGDVVVADSSAALRLLETSHPPTFYVPRADIDQRCLVGATSGSFCEWKGTATYFDVAAGQRVVRRAAWAYPTPIDEAFSALADHVAFYATDLCCFVGDERVRPQAGGFYGGWVTGELVGPFKGDPGTGGW